jgi:mevalonate kinase
MEIDTKPVAPWHLCPAAKGQAAGKVILMGEHAVVYGFPALAMALPDVRLTVEVVKPAHSLSHWEQGVEISLGNNPLEVPLASRRQVVAAFEKAMQAVEPAFVLAHHPVKVLRIQSDIPLGAGMGGSAAMSTAFLRYALEAHGERWASEKVSFFANEIDALFHGKASGLDAAAVSSDGVICFQRGKSIEMVPLAKPFWIFLHDTGERQATSAMVELVARQLEKTPVFVQRLLDNLGELTVRARAHLLQGELAALGHCLNLGHESLCSLGVSTGATDACVEKMRAHGALGAKLTGAGGGGLVLGLFETPPQNLLPYFGTSKNCYVSRLE